MSDSKLDKMITASAQDDSFESHKRSADRLRSGPLYDLTVAMCEAKAPTPTDFVARIVVDYIGFDPVTWDTRLVMYYTQHEEDPVTRIQTWRVSDDGEVTLP